MYYLKYFLITSIIGFLIETLICKFESGILYGPWTPVYGIGSIIIIILSDKILKKRNLNKISKFFFLIIFCMLLLSLAELCGGLLIEKIFHTSYWDYTNYKFNIGKYICLEMSLLWGLASVGFVCLMRPVIDTFIKKIPDFLIYVTSICFMLDIIYTIITKS